jgi:hypothetical protein
LKFRCSIFSSSSSSLGKKRGYPKQVTSFYFIKQEANNSLSKIYAGDAYKTPSIAEKYYQPKTNHKDACK